MNYAFWFSLVVLMYTYFGYPAYMFIRAKIARDGLLKDTGYKPFVSIVFSAHNEEEFIGKKIINLLDSDYPKDKMEILVGSDGSDDDTNEMLSRISDKRVKTFIFSERRGKVSVLNELVPKANGEILIFCDTRQLFDREAIENLTANFVNDRIGCVGGELVFMDNKGANGVSKGVGVYWEYEKFIRKCESAAHSMVGATGAIYAIRKELYSPPPANTILDDVYIPLAITRQGYRCIWDESARAYDKPSFISQDEYRRKVRTLAGNYQIFGMFKDLLVPFKSPVSIPFISHKLLRVIAPFFMIMVFVSNLFIAVKAPVYTLSIILQIVFYGMAAVGSPVPHMFCIMNFAAVVGLYRFVFNKQNIAWEK